MEIAEDYFDQVVFLIGAYNDVQIDFSIYPLKMIFKRILVNIGYKNMASKSK